MVDRIWNPPDVYARYVQHAIRTEQSAVNQQIGRMMEAHGEQAFHALLAPSLLKRR